VTIDSARSRWLFVFLSISVAAWGIGFGAKLFELVVLIPAWAADPPASLSLLPYGPRWPSNPGDFFQPLSALLVVGTVGSLISSRKATRAYRYWLWGAVASLVVIWAATPTLFWPMIRDLYAAGTGSRPLTGEAARSLASRWILYDWVRAAFIGLGFLCSVRTIGTRHEAFGA